MCMMAADDESGWGDHGRRGMTLDNAGDRGAADAVWVAPQSISAILSGTMWTVRGETIFP